MLDDAEEELADDDCPELLDELLMPAPDELDSDELLDKPLLSPALDELDPAEPLDEAKLVLIDDVPPLLLLGTFELLEVDPWLDPDLPLAFDELPELEDELSDNDEPLLPDDSEDELDPDELLDGLDDDEELAGALELLAAEEDEPDWFEDDGMAELEFDVPEPLATEDELGVALELLTEPDETPLIEPAEEAELDAPEELSISDELLEDGPLEFPLLDELPTDELPESELDATLELFDELPEHPSQQQHPAG